MATRRGTIPTILFFLGGLLAMSGLVFTLQGLGIVGPHTSFMFKSSTWVYEGTFTLVGGLLFIAIAIAFRVRRQELPQSTAESPAKKKGQSK